MSRLIIYCLLCVRLVYSSKNYSLVMEISHTAFLQLDRRCIEFFFSLLVLKNRSRSKKFDTFSLKFVVLITIHRYFNTIYEEDLKNRHSVSTAEC